MRQIYLVCVKHKHVKFMSEKHPALSLCCRLGIYIFLPSFHLDFVENIRSSQLEKRKKIQRSYLLRYDIMSPLVLIIEPSFRC